MQALKLLGCNGKGTLFNCCKLTLCSNILVNRSYCAEDQRTTVDIINREGEGPLMVSTYSQTGFRLNNGLFVVGPMIIFPSTVISWNVADDNDIDEPSLSLFEHMDPKVDILLVGISQPANKSQPKLLQLFKYLRKIKVNFELLECDRACPTFNFLSNEGRFVAAALIPPVKINVTSDDIYEQFRKDKESAGIDDYLIGDDIDSVTKFENEQNEKYKPIEVKDARTNLLGNRINLDPKKKED